MADVQELAVLQTMHERARRELASRNADLARLHAEKGAFVERAYAQQVLDTPAFQTELGIRQQRIDELQAAVGQLQTKESLLRSLLKMEGGEPLAADVEADPAEASLLAQARKVLAG